jgi:predicted alpha/beta-fold hydrolase
MPVITQSTYKAPAYLFNGHLQTIIPSAFRKVEGIRYVRERIETADGDFLDLDWSKTGSEKLVILSHGLEGSADRHYMKGMAKAFHKQGWDALAWNCRSCSGEMNRTARFYHHGDIHDLEAVIGHTLAQKQYQSIVLIGFSMGGSMTLRFLGEKGGHVPPAITKAVAFSVPCDLTTSVVHLSKPQNSFYSRRFLRKLEKKIQAKALLFPDKVSYADFQLIRAFKDFDNRYTAPLHGFTDAEDFYKQASVRPYLPGIRVPTLLVNALNDPFLTPECFPVTEAEANPYLFLEMPLQGGHVGFSMSNSDECWSEKRAVEFVLADQKVISQ